MAATHGYSVLCSLARHWEHTHGVEAPPVAVAGENELGALMSNASLHDLVAAPPSYGFNVASRQPPREKKCRSGHDLKAERVLRAPRRCEKCSKHLEAGGLSYSCRMCNFDLCKACYEAKGPAVVTVYHSGTSDCNGVYVEQACDAPHVKRHFKQVGTGAKHVLEYYDDPEYRIGWYIGGPGLVFQYFRPGGASTVPSTGWQVYTEAYSKPGAFPPPSVRGPGTDQAAAQASDHSNLDSYALWNYKPFNLDPYSSLSLGTLDKYLDNQSHGPAPTDTNEGDPEVDFDTPHWRKRIIMSRPLEGNKIGLAISNLEVLAILKPEASAYGWTVGDLVVCVNGKQVKTQEEFNIELQSAMDTYHSTLQPLVFEVRDSKSRIALSQLEVSRDVTPGHHELPLPYHGHGLCRAASCAECEAKKRFEPEGL